MVIPNNNCTCDSRIKKSIKSEGICEKKKCLNILVPSVGGMC